MAHDRIRFLPADPLADSESRERRIRPHGDRPTSSARFKLKGSVDVGIYELGTPEFLYWQCREAAHVALDAWEAIEPLFNCHRRFERLESFGGEAFPAAVDEPLTNFEAKYLVDGRNQYRGSWRAHDDR